MNLVDDALALSEQLNTAGIRAYVDPAAAAANRPCVLVPPPAVDFTTRATSWDLAVLSSHDTGHLAAFEELAVLTDAVEQLLPIENARPATYPLTDPGPVPAYILRYTT